MGARMRYDELPDPLKRRVDAAIAGGKQSSNATVSAYLTPAPSSKGPKMTKTEREFEAILAARHGRHCVLFQAVSFRLQNGHRYTPDFVVIVPGTAILTFYEVKGTYRLHSYGRARLAFDQARVEWPCWEWVWAERQKDGSFTEA